MFPGDLVDFVRSIVQVGVDIVQLRDSSSSPQRRVSVLRSVHEAIQGHRALLVTDDIAAAAGAGLDMVHVRRGVDGAVAKRSLHQWGLAGRSAHTPVEFAEAAADPAIDYLLVGSQTIDLAVRELPPFNLPNRSKPWFAVGGVTSDGISDLIERGVRRVCVSRAIMLADDPVAAAASLAEALQQAWDSDVKAEAYSLAAFDSESPVVSDQ